MKTIELYHDRIVCEGKTYLSRKGYAKKYAMRLNSVYAVTFEKNVNLLAVLGAKFIEDAPPIKKRYKKIAESQDVL